MTLLLTFSFYYWFKWVFITCCLGFLWDLFPFYFCVSKNKKKKIKQPSAIKIAICFRAHPLSTSCLLLNRPYVSAGALLQVLQKVEMDSRCKQAIMRVGALKLWWPGNVWWDNCGNWNAFSLRTDLGAVAFSSAACMLLSCCLSRGTAQCLFVCWSLPTEFLFQWFLLNIAATLFTVKRKASACRWCRVMETFFVLQSHSCQRTEKLSLTGGWSCRS